jgi:hypothetical protein
MENSNVTPLVPKDKSEKKESPCQFTISKRELFPN